MNVQILAVDGFISFCISLFWVGLLALARQAWWPGWDARWILVIGVGLFGFGVMGLAFIQGCNAVTTPRMHMAHRRPSAFWIVVKCAIAALVFVKGIQLVIVAMGAG